MIKRLVRNTTLSLWLSLQGVLVGCAQADLPDFTQLVEVQGQSVVNISTVPENDSGVDSENPLDDGLENTPFGELLRRFFEENGRDQERGTPDSQSLGSGVIISSEGFVVTNYHVIRNAKEIRVKLANHQEYKAKLLGKDQESDIALLKIEAKNLPVASLGNSDALKVGEWVLAIGSPFGFEQSATVGIVSALGRSLRSERYVPFIQTDVAINPGNSGGPLFNLKGEVVGINSQILSRTGGYMGVSFAIPVNVVKEIVEQLKTGRQIARGWIGVAFQDLTHELSESFGRSGTRGALVASVVPKSPAEKAKIQAGDVIVSFDGHVIENASELPHLVGRTKIGKRVTLELWRNKKLETVTLVIEALPKEYLALDKVQKGKPTNPLKIEVRELKPEERAQIELAENQKGVLIEWVDAGPAEDAGLVSGDIILAINHVPIKDKPTFLQIVQSLPLDKTAAVLIYREGEGQRFMAVSFPKQD